MAIDEALLESVGSGQSLPILRLYAWEPACLSLGYAQPVCEVDLVRLASLGWTLARRPTGGRAVLHTDELTYAVIAPLDEPRLAGSLLDSYRRLSTALVEALLRLGIPVIAQDRYALPVGGHPFGPVCFDVPSSFEITACGKKLVGSAQARRREGILQHGSLPLCGDLTRITQALTFPDDASRSRAAERLLEHATTAEAVLGRRIAWETAAQAFQSAFCEILDLEFIESPLTLSEAQRAKELVETKHSSESWTKKF